MSELRIDEAAVRWAVDGRATTADAAIAALAGGRPLLLLMHGYGSFEGDLIGLAPQLPTGFVCASPRAPLVAPAPIVNGFAWWVPPVDAAGQRLPHDPDTGFAETPVHAAAVAALEWLDGLERRVASSAEAGGGAHSGLGTIALMGFSQGGAMVTSLLRLRPRRFACGVNGSGFVAPGAFAGDAELAAIRPPLFWGRDEADPIIGAELIELTERWAPAHTALEARLYDGILHGIGQEELDDIGAFLVRHVPEAAR